MTDPRLLKIIMYNKTYSPGGEYSVGTRNDVGKLLRERLLKKRSLHKDSIEKRYNPDPNLAEICSMRVGQIESLGFREACRLLTYGVERVEVEDVTPSNPEDAIKLNLFGNAKKHYARKLMKKIAYSEEYTASEDEKDFLLSLF